MSYLKHTLCALSVCAITFVSSAIFAQTPSNPLEKVWTETNRQSVSHLHNSDLATIYGGEDFANRIHLNAKAVV